MIKTELEFKNLTASVVVDGKGLPCYASFVEKKDRHTSCWIASEESKHFSIHFTKYQTKCSVRATLYLDGKRMSRGYLKKSDTGDYIAFESFRTSKKTERPFLFAPLEVTNDEEFLQAALLNDNNNIKNLGEISIQVHRVTGLHYVSRKKRNTDDEDTGESSSSDDEIPEIQKVHEKSSKASIVPHQVSFGEKRKVNRCHDSDDEAFTTETVYSEIKDLIATFTFRYRPLEVLRLCGIAPHPPREPTPPCEKTPDNESIPIQGQPDVQPTSLSCEPTSILREQTPLHNGAIPAEDEPHTSMQIRQESDDESGTPLLEMPPSQHTNANDGTARPLSNKMEVVEHFKTMSGEEESKPDLSSDDDDDDDIAALKAQMEKIRNEKRKKREAAGSPRKKVKREPPAFFAPGETKRVIDLT